MNPSSELRQQIEELALRLVVEDADSGRDASQWLPVLERLAAVAARDHADLVAQQVNELNRSLRTLDEKPERTSCAVSALMQEGIANLQTALEQEQSPRTTLAQDPELLADFILESREHLVNIESQVLTLEKDPADGEALNAVFRGFHTIKGLAGFLELWEIQKLAHEVETVLARARNSQWTLNAAGFDVILESADYLRRWLAHLDARLHQKRSDRPERDEPLMERIACLTADEASQAVFGQAAEVGPTAEVRFQASRSLVPTGGEGAVEFPRKGSAPTSEPKLEPARNSVPASAVSNRDSEKTGTVYRHETAAVKVDTVKLDYLVDMAGEMVIAESLVRHDQELAGLTNPLLQRKIAHLTRITAELQKIAMSMRLVPVGPLFRRMARLVRDLSRQFGKQVEMETQGDDIELDRTIVEELADPLMHMVRNALDHGVETPAEREAAGKPPHARLLLKANHQAGQVVVEITDNGRGLNRSRIIDRAMAKGLIASEEGLAENEVFNLIFQPGFTTATQITNVSGRGVGMDVVRRHIEKLRGRIEIRSVAGEGATFLLKLPLTLAIIDGLVVGVGDQRYIVPLFAVRELFRPGPETMWTVQQRGEMALVRGSLLPVVRLYKKFRVTPGSEDPAQSVLVVAEVEGERFCVMVDELVGKQEVVIKSLGETFKGVAGVAGGAILGDGRVGLILDLEQIYRVKES